MMETVETEEKGFYDLKNGEVVTPGTRVPVLPSEILQALHNLGLVPVAKLGE